MFRELEEKTVKFARELTPIKIKSAALSKKKLL